jgi:hypothetical protein
LLCCSSFHQLPPPGAHVSQFNVVPLRSERDIVIDSFITGGTSVIDFTDPSDPREVGFYVADPNKVERRSIAFASYWYNGHGYVDNTRMPLSSADSPSRGFDVVSIPHPALRDFVQLGHMNAQTPVERLVERHRHDVVARPRVIAVQRDDVADDELAHGLPSLSRRPEPVVREPVTRESEHRPLPRHRPRTNVAG